MVHVEPLVTSSVLVYIIIRRWRALECLLRVGSCAQWRAALMNSTSLLTAGLLQGWGEDRCGQMGCGDFLVPIDPRPQRTWPDGVFWRTGPVVGATGALGEPRVGRQLGVLICLDCEGGGLGL